MTLLNFRTAAESLISAATPRTPRCSRTRDAAR